LRKGALATKQSTFLVTFWIASRSLSSGAHSRDPLARNDGGGYFAARIFAFKADATRLTGGRPINRLTTFVAATSFGMSTPVEMPMPSSM
jgi:hypothetical protein